ncbi:MAG: PQQ-binding-like beta-propeller repeat protein, partial [Bryobacteraceae bacterium]
GFFGAAASPLVEGNRVLLNVGGKNAGIAAFDAATGKTLWTSTTDEASYASPAAHTIAGARHALFFTRAGLVSLDPVTGRERFRWPWRARMNASVNASTPIVAGNFVFISASYGTGAAVLEIGPGGPKKVWSSDDALSNHYATSVHHDGFLYGYHGRQEEGPSLRSVELAAGKVRWSVDRFRAGTILLAGSTLLIQREDGELVLAPASPAAFRPLARAQVVGGTVRAYPALAGGLWFVRNEKTLVAVGLR